MDKLYATGVVYDEDGSVREIFQHDNEKDVHDMMAYVLSISSKNLTSEYIGLVSVAENNYFKNSEWRQ